MFGIHLRVRDSTQLATLRVSACDLSPGFGMGEYSSRKSLLCEFSVSFSPNWTFGFGTSLGLGGLNLGLKHVSDNFFVP